MKVSVVNMRNMITRVSKELIDYKLSTRVNRSNYWTNVKVEVSETTKRILIRDSILYYIPNTEEYDFIDALVKPKGIACGSCSYKIIKAAEVSEPVTEKIKEAKFGEYNVITSEVFTVNGVRFGYDIKKLKNFPKKDITYNKVIVQGSPMLVIKQGNEILGLLLPIKCYNQE